MKSLTDIMVSNISSKLEVLSYLPHLLVYFFEPSKYLNKYLLEEKKWMLDSIMQCSDVRNNFYVKSLV